MSCTPRRLGRFTTPCSFWGLQKSGRTVKAYCSKESGDFLPCLPVQVSKLRLLVLFMPFQKTERHTWMHRPNSGEISFFTLSRINPNIFSTEAVSCCLNRIAGYLASTGETPSSKPICFRGVFIPYQTAQVVQSEETHIDLMQTKPVQSVQYVCWGSPRKSLILTYAL